MANHAGELPLTVTVDGCVRPARSDYTWTAGGLVLTISTVIPEPGLAFELHSTYTAGPETDTIAVHLALVLGADGETDTRQHPREELNPCELARACAYDHANQLIAALAGTGRLAQVTLDERSFAELERVE